MALLDILQCPSCYGHLSEGQKVLLCDSCGLRFPVTDGIPDLTFYRSGTAQHDANVIQASYERDLHDREAESRYEELVIRVFGTKTKLIVQRWAARLQGLTPSARVLDYGCGTGQVSRVLARQCRPLFAFDISPASVRQNVATNAVLGCVANAFSLQFKDRAFDAVCINGVLHHIVDLTSAIDEISRVTRELIFVSEGMPRPSPSLWRSLAYPGVYGKLIYGSYVVLHTVYRVLRKLRRMFRTIRGQQGSVGASTGSKYERPLACEEVEALFQKAGFVRERLQYWTNLDYPGTGFVKRMAMTSLVNETIGTHFDLHLRRNH
jgi:SAM-dependent methyltransferase